MSRSTIPQRVRERIAEQAQRRCGYCQTQESVVGMPLEIDHIIPVVAGGSSEEGNLWLACPRCNVYKGDQTSAWDEETGESAPIFDPRRQRWDDHFAWQQGGLIIAGLTPTGRVTVEALQMNNAFVVRSRRVWILWSWHPPT